MKCGGSCVFTIVAHFPADIRIYRINIENYLMILFVSIACVWFLKQVMFAGGKKLPKLVVFV